MCSRHDRKADAAFRLVFMFFGASQSNSCAARNLFPAGVDELSQHARLRRGWTEPAITKTAAAARVITTASDLRRCSGPQEAACCTKCLA